MGTKYRPITVTLPAATLSRLKRGGFDKSNQRQVADHAVEMIRVALFTIFPPRTPEERQDMSRMQGAWGRMLRQFYDVFYDVARHMLGQFTGRRPVAGEEGSNGAMGPHRLTLMIPAGFMKWIEEIAHGRQLTIPEATAYAVEYGVKVVDSERGAEGGGSGGRPDVE